MFVIKDKTLVIVGLCAAAFVLALLSRFYVTGGFLHLLSVARIAGRAAIVETYDHEAKIRGL